MNPFRTATRLITHQLASAFSHPGDAFARDFKENILKDSGQNPDFLHIEHIREMMLKDNRGTGQADPGAGSRISGPQRTVAEFTRRASVRPRYGRLLYRMAQFYTPPVILELGTAVGMGTMYLASGYPHARVLTIEGNPQLADIASENFRRARFDRISVIKAEFDEGLSQFSGQIPGGSLVYIDGNHTGEAMQRYFTWLAERLEKPIFIIDDINWSESMNAGWKRIRETGFQGLWIDLFNMGMFMGNYPGQAQFVQFRY